MQSPLWWKLTSCRHHETTMHARHTRLGDQHHRLLLWLSCGRTENGDGQRRLTVLLGRLCRTAHWYCGTVASDARNQKQARKSRQNNQMDLPVCAGFVMALTWWFVGLRLRLHRCVLLFAVFPAVPANDGEPAESHRTTQHDRYNR